MSLLESGLVLRFMEGNLGKGSVTHNDHAARNVIFFVVFQSSVCALFVHLHDVRVHRRRQVARIPRDG